MSATALHFVEAKKFRLAILNGNHAAILNKQICKGLL